jgi:hypothetical protein
LQATTTIGDLEYAGSVVPVLCNFSSLPPGVPAWFQIQVYDSRASSAQGAWNLNYYAGISQVFQATPQASTFPPICQSSFPVNSSWAAGTFEPVDFAPYEPGYYGAIEVYANTELPEPPYIWTQPKSTNTYWGQSVTFSALVEAWPVPSYQWRVNGTNLYDGSHVSTSVTYYVGGQSYQLTLNGVTVADVGSYRLFLSNHWDTALSDPATLTVDLIPPAISSVLPQPDGSVTLNLTGTPYSTNRLWATADLTPPVVWSPVSTNVASSAGTWQVTDTTAVGWTNRFYRTSMP